MTLEGQATALSEQAALLDLTQGAIVVRPADGRIFSWNQGAEAMYGWSSHEAFGQMMGELLTAEYLEPLATSCLLPDLDVLLPAVRGEAEAERFVVAGFTDEKGAF